MDPFGGTKPCLKKAMADQAREQKAYVYAQTLNTYTERSKKKAMEGEDTIHQSTNSPWFQQKPAGYGEEAGNLLAMEKEKLSGYGEEEREKGQYTHRYTVDTRRRDNPQTTLTILHTYTHKAHWKG